MRVIAQSLSPVTGEKGPARQAGQLYLNVIYTDPEATRVALSHAVGLTADRGARIRMIVLKTVPFPLGLNDPPVSAAFDRNRAVSFADQMAPDSTVLVCYCRDAADALVRLLVDHVPEQGHDSFTVIAGKKRRWFPSKAQLMARRLEKAGQQVLFVDSRGNHA